jgi:hypothetical protein
MDDRQLMQQALDALNKALPRLAPYGEQDWLDCKAAIKALRERLAHCDRCGKKLGGEGDIHTCTPDPIGDAQDRLIAEIAAQPEQEPVAWEHHEYRPYGAPGEMRIHAILASQYTMPDGSVSGNFQWLVNQYKEDKNTIKLIPLYTAAQRKPQYNKTEMNCFVQNLYDEKMRESKHGHYEAMFHVVHRAIEAAYGIKEKNT